MSRNVASCVFSRRFLWGVCSTTHVRHFKIPFEAD